MMNTIKKSAALLVTMAMLLSAVPFASAVEDGGIQTLESHIEMPAPEATAPEATAPEATAPEATAPEATAPEAAAPEAAAPVAPASAAQSSRAPRPRKVSVAICQYASGVALEKLSGLAFNVVGSIEVNVKPTPTLVGNTYNRYQLKENLVAGTYTFTQSNFEIEGMMCTMTARLGEEGKELPVTVEGNSVSFELTQEQIDGIEAGQKNLAKMNLHLTNHYTEVPALFTLKLLKNTSGIALSELPEAFAVTLNGTDENGEAVEMPLVRAVQPEDGNYVWTSASLNAGTYTVTEAGHALSGKTCTLTADGMVPVQVEGFNATFTVGKEAIAQVAGDEIPQITVALTNTYANIPPVVEPDPTYTVTYEWDANHPADAVLPSAGAAVNQGAVVTLPVVESQLEDWSFVNWTLKDAADGEIITDNTFAMPGRNVTVVGHWQQYYTVAAEHDGHSTIVLGDTDQTGARYPMGTPTSVTYKAEAGYHITSVIVNGAAQTDFNTAEGTIAIDGTQNVTVAVTSAFTSIVEPDDRPTPPTEPDDRPTPPAEPDDRPVPPVVPDEDPVLPVIPEVELEENEIPLAQLPVVDAQTAETAPAETIIVDSKIPMGNLPQTGTTATKTPVAGLLALMAALAFGGFALATGRKEEEEI